MTSSGISKQSLSRGNCQHRSRRMDRLTDEERGKLRHEIEIFYQGFSATGGEMGVSANTMR